MKSAKAARRCNQAAAAVCAIDEVWQCIRYKAMPIADIIGHLCSVQRLEILGLKKADSGDIGGMIEQTVRDNSDICDERLICMLCEFFCSLGKSDLSGQQSICEQYRKKTADYCGDLKERLQSEQRLCSALGVLGGLFCAVLLI